jgi:hypothetical protein
MMIENLVAVALTNQMKPFMDQIGTIIRTTLDSIVNQDIKEEVETIIQSQVVVELDSPTPIVKGSAPDSAINLDDQDDSMQEPTFILAQEIDESFQKAEDEPREDDSGSDADDEENTVDEESDVDMASQCTADDDEEASTNDDGSDPTMAAKLDIGNNQHSGIGTETISHGAKDVQDPAGDEDVSEGEKQFRNELALAKLRSLDANESYVSKSAVFEDSVTETESWKKKNIIFLDESEPEETDNPPPPSAQPQPSNKKVPTQNPTRTKVKPPHTKHTQAILFQGPDAVARSHYECHEEDSQDYKFWLEHLEPSQLPPAGDCWCGPRMGGWRNYLALENIAENQEGRLEQMLEWYRKKIEDKGDLVDNGIGCRVMKNYRCKLPVQCPKHGNRSSTRDGSIVPQTNHPIGVCYKAVKAMLEGRTKLAKYVLLAVGKWFPAFQLL